MNFECPVAMLRTVRQTPFSRDSTTQPYEESIPSAPTKASIFSFQATALLALIINNWFIITIQFLAKFINNNESK